MPTKKQSSLTLPKKIEKSLEAMSKGLGVATKELWIIFVREYLVRGLAEIFVAVVIAVATYFLAPYIGLWAIIPGIISLLMTYLGLRYVGNPRYYALEDIMSKLGQVKKELSKGTRTKITREDNPWTYK